MKPKRETTRGLLAGRRHLQEELRTCRAKLDALLDSVNSGVAVYEVVNEGEDFIFVDFNPAAEDIDQISKDRVIGKSVAEVFPGVRDFGLFEVFQRVWKTGKPEHHPVSVYKDERIAGWRENYVYRLPCAQVMAVYHDATTLKRSELATRMSEQCFRAIADYTYDWEVWVGPNGRVLWTNPAAARLTGYTIKELMAMSDYPQPLIHEQDRHRVTRAFRSAVKGTVGNDLQFRLMRKDGKVVWAEMSWQPICDEEGGSLGHRQSIRDITARKHAEQALLQSEEKYRKLLERLSRRSIRP